MPASTDYLLRIRAVGWDGLQQMWQTMRTGPAPGWEPGKAFEYLILRAFELDGAEVKWPYTVPFQGQLIEQIDGAVYTGSLACLVEAKDSTRPVQFDSVAKLNQQLSRRPSGVMGLLFSRTGFTEPAVTLARFLTPQNIMLWSGNDLTVALHRRAMVRALETKYRHAVENGVSKYDLPLEWSL